MADTTHEAPEKMKTIRLTVDLTYDQEVMHGDDEEAIAWFNSILAGNNLMLGDFGELGDMIGSVKVVTQQDDLVQAAVAAALREAAKIPDQWVGCEPITSAILALITPDAQAALDRALLAEVRAVKDSLTAAYIELAAERERCARVAESVALPMDGRNAKAQAGYMRGIIAHYIRKGRE